MKNKKQLYEAIMSSVAKEVKKALNEGQEKVGKYEFSQADLDEIKEIILTDEDFYETYCKYGNMEYFNSYEEAVDDFMNFIGSDVYTGDPEDDKEVHRWYILDDTNLGTSSYQLQSGKIVNADNLWQEFKSVISQK